MTPKLQSRSILIKVVICANHCKVSGLSQLPWRSVSNVCAKNGIQCAQGNKLLIFCIKHGLWENAVPYLNITSKMTIITAQNRTGFRINGFTQSWCRAIDPSCCSSSTVVVLCGWCWNLCPDGWVNSVPSMALPIRTDGKNPNMSQLVIVILLSFWVVEPSVTFITSRKCKSCSSSCSLLLM